jgi:hypothetical protein
MLTWLGMLAIMSPGTQKRGKLANSIFFWTQLDMH